MAQFFSQYGPLLAEGVWESVYMTLATTALAYVLGLPMGVLLTVTKRGGIAAAPRFHAVFGWVVNILRSLPFLILMFFVIPFTRLVAGTSIGPTAALVPLTISASPFIARMVEQSLEEIDAGPYAHGLYQTPAGPLYVSAGLGESGPRIRLCAPREVAVFNIRP